MRKRKKTYRILYFMAGNGASFDHGHTPPSLAACRRIAETTMRGNGYARAEIYETCVTVIAPKIPKTKAKK